MNADTRKTVADFEERIRKISSEMFILGRSLDNFEGDKPDSDERVHAILRIAQGTLENMSYTLDTITDGIQDAMPKD